MGQTSETLNAYLVAHDETKGAFNSVQSSLKSLAQGIAAIGGFRTLVNGAKDVIDSFQLSSQVNAQLEAVIASTGAAAGVSAQHVRNLATEIQNTTPLSDEAATAAANMALTFRNISAGNFDESVKGIIDMATAMNGGATPAIEQLQQTAIQLGKALNDPKDKIAALTRVGITFTNAQKDMIASLYEAGRGAEAQKIIMQEIATEFGGSASAQTATFGGQLQMLANHFDDVKEKIGGLLSAALTPFVQKTIQFVTANQQTVVSLLTAGAAVVAFGTAIMGIVSVVKIVTALLAFTGPFGLILLALSAFLGVTMYKTMQNFQKQMTDTANATTKATDAMGTGAKKDFGEMSTATSDAIAKAKEYDEKIQDTKNSFIQQMAEMVASHQQKVADITAQLSDENAAWDDANKKRAKSFDQANRDETTSHQRKVADIQKQLDEQTALYEYADKDKIASLQLALEQENADYAQSMSDRAAQYEQDTADATAAHDKKIASLNSSLKVETDLLSKHADDVKSVQGVALQDEFDKLHESTNKQIEEFNRAKDQAISSAGLAADGIGDQYGTIPGSVQGMIAANNSALTNALGGVGDNMGKAFVKAIEDSLKQVGQDLLNFTRIPQLGDFAQGLGEKVGNWINSLGKRAMGGPVSAGGTYLVGENGPEVVSFGSRANITPTNELRGGQSVQINIYGSISMRSDQEIDDIGRRLGQALQNASAGI